MDSCSGKFIVGNQKIMSTFVELQSLRQQQMFSELPSQQQQHTIDSTDSHLTHTTMDTADASSSSRT